MSACVAPAGHRPVCVRGCTSREVKSLLGEALTALGRREASGGVVPSTSQPFKVAFCLTGKSRLGFGCGHRTSWAGVSQTLHCTCEISRLLSPSRSIPPPLISRFSPS
ncbi:hypothetical protein CDEST_10871 [Colletotrichum destructivum]|uniref:Uncharacterized protein n=1 Tax=Colletotrichum destructivum TaxID=34406 RepID=A0AAX4IRI8_9PEZI|nr:hypothetical protein CDEST_10871 [Colletotrichum destructivum]